MRAKWLLWVVGLSCGLLVASSAFAHHGTAAYDMKNVVTITGTVTDFEFINPHSQIYLSVNNDKGEVEAWQGEITAPNKLARAGWTKHTLKPGDQITVTGPTSKTSKHSVWIQKLIGPDGQPLPLFED